MKTLPTLILLALICFLHHSSAGPVAIRLIHEEPCCPSFSRRIIPKPKVKHVAKTPRRCKTTAIVVTTVCGSKSCIDPNWRWAKKLLEEFKKLTANNRSPSAPFNVVKCEKQKRKHKSSVNLI
ncbi:C-C motif chemokine 14-like isoform X2 [Scomber scombrus]|uniref:C-C motif chemokine 14-like isoform X2 n=1 Tax=Scomber scombrus TaxID=13677 RepID=UPI002DDB1F7A|nr:C-C motif chemokine 14-like isoform X2 [Scomber scombrus]